MGVAINADSSMSYRRGKNPPLLVRADIANGCLGHSRQLVNGVRAWRGWLRHRCVSHAMDLALGRIAFFRRTTTGAWAAWTTWFVAINVTVDITFFVFVFGCIELVCGNAITH